MSSKLPRIQLGRTDMEVTRLGYGAMELRGPEIWEGRAVTDQQAENVLNAVLDAGINFIDTANAYGPSEEYIGKYIRHRKKDYYLATKCNHFDGLHQSLKRLQMESVDLIQLHNPSIEWMEKNDTVNTLKKMKEQGKTRWIGMSTGIPDLPVVLSWNVFDVIQTHYSILDRRYENWITKIAHTGLGTVINGGVARGEPSIGFCYQFENRWQKYDEANLDELRDPDDSKTAFILRLSLSHPDIHTLIVGTLYPEHVKENVITVGKGPLPPSVINEVKRRLDAIGVKPFPD